MPKVIVVGAGPVGLLTAAELSRLGVEVLLIDQHPTQRFGSRAIGVHAPVLAALEDSGLTTGLLDRARRVRRAEARSEGRLLGTVSFNRLSTRFPFVATLPQAATEKVLSSAAPPPERGVDVTAIVPTEHGVRVRTGGNELQAPLVVLAGGTRSRALVYRDPAVRSYPDRYVMTDAAVPASEDSDTAVVHLDRGGVLESFPLPGGHRRFVAWGAADRLRRELGKRLVDVGGGAEASFSEFGVRRFIAPRMRNGRLFVIGDAAHEVSPIGGQGMNLGLLDAVSLAPLLAEWVRTGVSPDADLKTWERARLTSARRAAVLAEMNTLLGRPTRTPLHAARSAAVQSMLGPGAGRIFTRAYSMGFDLQR